MTTHSGKLSDRLAGEIRQQFLGHVDTSGSSKPDLRVVLYSHDTMGIGHMRRNMLIASSIKKNFPNASILAIAGAKEACLFAQNANIDCLTLPSFQKRIDGTYCARSLGIPADEILNVRSRTILAAIQSYQPDLLIADKIPSGAGGELLPALEWLTMHSNCHCVLGLRDILDSSAKVIHDWQLMHSFEIVRNHYQAIWIYGDRQVYDPIKEYEFPADITEKVRFTGYLDAHSRLNGLPQSSTFADSPYVLCTVGGGQDGKKLALNFVEAIRITGRPSVLLTGPYMPASTRSLVSECASSVPSLSVLEFVNEGDILVRNASHVVSMGGYNTMTAILSYQKPALIVPRIIPRQEQLIRAMRMAQLEHVTAVHPDELDADSIVRWLQATPDSRPMPLQPLDMLGLDRISESIHAQFPAVKFHQPATGQHV